MSVTFGDELAARMREKGLTPLAIAERLDIDRSTVTRWIQGLSMPSVDKIPALAEMLDVEPAEFVRLMGPRVPIRNDALGRRVTRLEVLVEELTTQLREVAQLLEDRLREQ